MLPSFSLILPLTPHRNLTLTWPSEGAFPDTLRGRFVCFIGSKLRTPLQPLKRSVCGPSIHLPKRIINNPQYHSLSSTPQPVGHHYPPNTKILYRSNSISTVFSSFSLFANILEFCPSVNLFKGPISILSRKELPALLEDFWALELTDSAQCSL